MDASEMPNSANRLFWPSSVAPPWLPMAGTTNGWPPTAFTVSTAARVILTRFWMPRLPAVMAIRAPGLIFETRGKFFKPVATAAAASSGLAVSNVCLMRVSFGKAML